MVIAAYKVSSTYKSTTDRNFKENTLYNKVFNKLIRDPITLRYMLYQHFFWYWGGSADTS